jgi:hypothetical protein
MRVSFVVVSVLCAVCAQAATLKVDSSKSQITLSGTVVGSALQEQATGSLTTTVGGTIDVTAGGGQIQITSAKLDPNINGNWAPGRQSTGNSTDPADLGGEAHSFAGTITGALRDLLVDANSSAKTLSADGQFDASSIIFFFPTNSTSVLDYKSFLGPGSQPLAGGGTNQTATVGTFVDNNGVQTLTIALNATFYFSLLTPNDTALTLKGQLFAATPPPPAPSITGAKIVNGDFQFTGTDTDPSTVVESSTTLTSWGPQEAVIITIDPATRNFTVTAKDKFRFFRLKQ